MKNLVTNYPVVNPLSTKITGWGNLNNDSDNDRKKTTPNLKLNNDNFRCDNFIVNPKDYHVLFSGCSVSFGNGLEEEEIWTKKIYNKINNIKKCSGYFNLAMPGISNFEIVANIFKYIYNFGNPDVIFICLTGINRRYVEDYYDNDIKIKTIKHAMYKKNKKDEFYPLLPIHSFHYLFFLEMYCKSNNINLYYFSWEDGISKKFELERYIQINQIECDSFIKDNLLDNIENKYYITARDGLHFGTAYHDYWSDLLYNIYYKEVLL